MKHISLNIVPTKTETVIKLTSNDMLTKGSYHFRNKEDAKNSPLAQELFLLPFIKQIFISANFIALERYDFVSWDDVQGDLKEQIENYIADGGILVVESNESKLAVEVFSESTPNPEVLKFVTNMKLVQDDLEIKTPEEAGVSPLATALFEMAFVKEIFISGSYVSITKLDTVNWQDIKNSVRDFIIDYLSAGNKVVSADSGYIKESSANSELDEVSQQIVGILDEYIRPAVAADGGNILFQSYDEHSKTVSVILQGACSGCPSSTITLKNGIEHMLKQLIPGKIEEVVALNH